jgi:alpha-amylase/alpha-mannosidase (GH57 family)
MPTPEPLHVAFVWHMHQPYYRSARGGAFEMPWARMHALKDYLDMVESLAPYPDLHQTFNLVPSLVEQLEAYAAGDFVDVYWEHTLKPAAELDPSEQAFVLERMCEHPDHPRARSHPRYLELAQKRMAQAPHGWETCAGAFTVDDLRDLQVWFNLAWFDPGALSVAPLSELVSRGSNFREEDKQVIARAQADILARTLPAYMEAAGRGQIELSTSPYFHPILPLLANSDSTRIAAPDTLLPPRRFAHPEDAAEQVMSAMDKHERVFGERPRGMWCSEQAVGEDVIPLLIQAGLSWTISDETVLARSLSGAAAPRDVLDSRDRLGAGLVEGRVSLLDPASLYAPYRLERETGEIAMIFRDHTLSDLIGFAYQAWDSRDAAADLVRRLHELHAIANASPLAAGARGSLSAAERSRPPLVTIALDGENAWEYYPRDGRDFLRYLYEALSADPSLRCVTVSEHLRESPPIRSLGWLHTGSWIGGDLRTWSGDRAHNAAWELLHRARDFAAARRLPVPAGATDLNAGLDPGPVAEPGASPGPSPAGEPGGGQGPSPETGPEAAWGHILVAEGSDWFWWFGDHHHTELDHVWDLHFRLHLQEVYHSLGEPVPVELFIPILEQAPSAFPAPPQGMLAPVIDGVAGDPAEWSAAGFLAVDVLSTMQRSEATKIREVRFGWRANDLCLLVVPGPSALLEGLEIELRVTRPGCEEGPVVRMILEEHGHVEVSCIQSTHLVGTVEAVWKDVLEALLPLEATVAQAAGQMGLIVHIGRDRMTEHVFHSGGLVSIGNGGR